MRVLDPEHATQADLGGYYEVVVGAAPDWSDDPPDNYDVIIARLRAPGAVFGPSTVWLGYRDGVVVGFLRASLPEDENREVAVVRLSVHPDHRCRGVGGGMLRGVLPILRGQGRTVVEGWNIPADGIGERWAVRLGFARTNATVVQQLLLADVDPARWAVEVPAGYRLLRWAGSAPDEHVESFARAQNAMHDAPRGGVGLKVPLWTVRRVRADEDETRTHGTRRLVVAALHEASNEIAGFSEVELRPGMTDRAVINNTAVRSEHRGHGLGRVVKADQARWLCADHPGFTRVMTSTSASNRYMIKVNEQVGYTTTRATAVVSADLDALAARLGSTAGDGRL